MRGRAWRRFQNKRIINKRVKIVKECWFSGSSCYGRDDRFERWLDQNPRGSLKKYNFTCGCGMCKMDKYNRKREEDRIKRYFNEEYGSVIYF